MMSQSKFVVGECGAAPSSLPSLPYETIAYVWAAVTAPQARSAPKTYPLPQPSLVGNVFTYVGARYVLRSSAETLASVTPEMAAAALYLLRSVARASHAVAMVRMSAIVRFCFERCMAVSRFGIAI